MQALLKKTQRRCAGHVARMLDERISKCLFFGELAKPNLGSQKKRYKDTLKASLKQTHLNPPTWQTEAQQRSAWRCTIHNATKSGWRRRRKRDRSKSRDQQILLQQSKQHTSVLPVAGLFKPESASSATAGPTSPSPQRDVLGHRRQRRTNNIIAHSWLKLLNKCSRSVSNMLTDVCILSRILFVVLTFV